MAKSKNRAPRSKAALYKKQAMEEKKMLGAINAERRYVYLKGLNMGYSEATVIMLWLLRTEYGFGKKRLAKFMRQITDFCGEYVLPSQEKQKEGEYQGITLEDMAEALKDECDIHFDLENGMVNIENILVAKKEEEGAEDDGTAEARRDAGQFADC